MSISRFSSLLAFTLFSVAVTACGSEGPAGEMGDMGDPGSKGDKGDMGDPGTPGGMGTPGTPGGMGSNGTNGTNGAACWDLNSNGTCDVGTEDKNTDAACTPLDCAGPQGPAGTANITGQRANSVFGSASLTLVPSAAFTLVPGLSTTQNFPATANIQITTNGGFSTTSNLADGFSMIDVAIFIDNGQLADGGYQRVVAANTAGIVGMINNWNMSVSGTLAAGNHTIEVRATGTGIGSDATVGGSGTSPLQGTLSVTVVKL